MKIRGKDSFNISRLPFFYGYIIAIAGTIGVWSSMPGQTIGVSIFTDPVKDALGLSRNQFSASYMIGTLISSFMISGAGRLFDKYGARTLAAIAALILACSLFLASVSHHIVNIIQSFLSINHWLIPFFLMIIIFFILRLSGQGVLTMASRNMIMKWFERYRGRVNAFKSLSISLGFSISPLLLNQLISEHEWYGAWRIMGVGLIVMFFVIILLYRDKPENHGLKPDGKLSKKAAKAKKNKEDEQVDFKPKEAFRTRAFWMYSLMLSFNSFFITGYTFHIVSIFKSVGYERAEAISVFIPISIIAVTFSLLFNFLSDWIRLKIILYIKIIGGFMSILGLALLSHKFGLCLFILGTGIMAGLFSVLNSVTWPQLYGRQYIGSISGKALSMAVFASALAPMIFSLSYSIINTYTGVSIISFFFLTFVAIGALKANNPKLIQQEEK